MIWRNIPATYVTESALEWVGVRIDAPTTVLKSIHRTVRQSRDIVIERCVT